nr:unnamed protein product [Callosobruchus analis]
MLIQGKIHLKTIFLESTGFLRRHPEIAIRTPEGVTASSSNISESDIRSWFNVSCKVYHADESGFVLYRQAGKVLAQRGTRNAYEVEQGNVKANITVSFTFSASGEVAPPYYKRPPAAIVKTVPDH